MRIACDFFCLMVSATFLGCFCVYQVCVFFFGVFFRDVFFAKSTPGPRYNAASMHNHRLKEKVGWKPSAHIHLSKSRGNLPGYPEAKAPHPEAKALLKPWDHGGSSLKAGIVTYE